MLKDRSMYNVSKLPIVCFSVRRVQQALVSVVILDDSPHLHYKNIYNINLALRFVYGGFDPY